MPESTAFNPDENKPLHGRDDSDLNIGVGILMLAGDGRLRKCRERLHPQLLETLGMESLAPGRVWDRPRAGPRSLAGRPAARPCRRCTSSRSRSSARA